MEARDLAQHYKDGRDDWRRMAGRLAEVLEILAIDASENDAYLIGLALAEYREF